jgi:pimeloyl-ACP methyl ester carboxylesterase
VPVTTTENNFGKIDKTFVVCEKDKIFSATAQKELVKTINCNKAISINTGHVPHVENPEILAEIILKS